MIQNNISLEADKKKRFLGKKKFSQNQKLAFFLFLLPNLILFSVYTFLPVFVGFYYSFTKFDGTGIPKWVGLKNYLKIFRKFPRSDFFQTLGRTSGFVLFTVIGIALCSLFLAYVVSRPAVKWKGAMRTIGYLPSIMSFVVIGVLWRWLLADSFSIINQLLEAMNRDPIKTLSDPTFAFWATVVVTIWSRTGFYMIIFMGGLLNIPVSLYEASNMDGANKVKQFIYITLPLLRPTTLIVIILSVTESFKAFPLIKNLTQGGPGVRTTYLVQYIYEKGIGGKDYGYASAMSFFLLFILASLTLMSLKLGGEKNA